MLNLHSEEIRVGKEMAEESGLSLSVYVGQLIRKDAKKNKKSLKKA